MNKESLRLLKQFEKLADEMMEHDPYSGDPFDQGIFEAGTLLLDLIDLIRKKASNDKPAQKVSKKLHR